MNWTDESIFSEMLKCCWTEIITSWDDSHGGVEAPPNVDCTLQRAVCDLPPGLYLQGLHLHTFCRPIVAQVHRVSGHGAQFGLLGAVVAYS